jgi:energy-coupling factor transport system permease protein
MKPLDPRTKLVIGIVVIAAVFAARHPVSLLGQFGVLLTMIFIFKLSAPFVRSLKLIVPMIGLVFFISLISFDRDTALLLCIRLFNLLTSSFLVFQNVRPEDLAVGLRKMKMPFGFVFMLTTAVRFVPLMQNKIGSIRDAQMSRGIDLRMKLRNVKNFISMLEPLLLQSFILADELAVAMEVRGYSIKKRSFRKDYRLGYLDYIIMVASVAVLIIFIVWETG